VSHNGAPFCVCDECTQKTAERHADADKSCGREWVCACGACRRVRQSNALKEIDERFAKLARAEIHLGLVRRVKESE
jgi:hypothetical protein